MDITLLGLVAWGLFLLIVGYSLAFVENKKLARILAWLLVVGTAIFPSIYTQEQTPLYRMAAIVTLLLVSMKAIVLVETYGSKPKLHFLQWLGFAQGWFGMRPMLFETLFSKPLDGLWALLFKSISRIAFGFLLLYISTQTEGLFAYNFYSSDLLMLAGMSFILHFGLLNLATLFWRGLGVDVTELFISPYKSKSLGEFWGKRWNMAFSEMTSLIIYKPLIGSYGKNNAMIAAFLVSGLLHEFAISFPVQTGYGLPLLFFVIHSIGMAAERKLGLVQQIIEHPVWSRIWVFSWLLIPMPLLFHPSFVELVAKPLRALLLGVFGL